MLFISGFHDADLVQRFVMRKGFALLPTASAYENVELGLRISGVPRHEWDMRVRRCLAAVGLTAWMDHRPYEMSGASTI